MRLSEHFALSELTKSATAVKRNLDNTPDVDALANLSRLATEILEPVRFLLDCVVDVESGYRSEAVNGSIPEVGAKRSAHCDGRAADIVPRGQTFRQAFDAIRASDIPFDQLILESGCVHIAIARDGETPRRQCLIRGGVAGHWSYEEVE